MIGGALSSVVAVRLVTGLETGWAASLVLGGLFGALGWMLADTMGDAVVVLIETSFPGLVVLAFLENDWSRILAATFICGLNAGKLIASAEREK